MTAPLVVGSVCTGIGGAEVAWAPLGWRSAWCAETEPFASAVLATRFPDTPNLGDFTKILRGVDADAAIDVLVGGAPCQAFSVAGNREGLDDPRGNLTLEFLGLVGRVLPRWVVYENVPGLLSIDNGRTFGTFLGILGQLGYGFAYCVLDAQFFHLAQRRARVFVVGYRGDWRPPAAVLFERECLSGHPAPRRETGTSAAATLRGRAASSGRGSYAGRSGEDDVNLVAGALRAGSGGGCGPDDSSAQQNHLIASPLTCPSGSSGYRIDDNDIAGNHAAVRRLTPLECERLQGFPDLWTLVRYRGKLAADGPRYRALGNSFPVPVLYWIGQRLGMVHAILRELGRAA